MTGTETQYNPEEDPGVERLLGASSEEEQLAIERELVQPTDNGWQEGDPEDQPE